MGTSTKKKTAENTDVEREYSLVLHNDDFNEFDFVVDTLIVVCGHNFEQAYQCALITHHKGKCEVKKGGFEQLKPMRQRIVDRGIEATID